MDKQFYKRATIASFLTWALAVVLTMTALAAPAKFKSATSSIVASDTALSFGGAYSHWVVKTSVGASDVYLDMNNGTATSADFLLDGGGGLSSLAGAPAITGFHYLGTGTTGKISWQAWND